MASLTTISATYIAFARASSPVLLSMLVDRASNKRSFRQVHSATSAYSRFVTYTSDTTPSPAIQTTRYGCMDSVAELMTDDFETDYEQALKVYKTLQKSSKLGRGQIHDYFSGKIRAAPKIQFIGAFDTVKVVNDRSLYDISFNESIQDLRHALALDETRASFTPEYMFLEFNKSTTYHLVRLLVLSYVGANCPPFKFCIELNSARTKQKGTVELFKRISQNAKGVPIVIFGTKKDEFIGVEVAEARRKARKGGGDKSLAAFDAYAEAQFMERMREIESELLSIEGGRFDAAPLLKDAEEAVAVYRQISNKVLRKVEKIVPRYNRIGSFQTERAREHFEQVVGKYKDLVTAGIGPGTNLKMLDEKFQYRYQVFIGCEEALGSGKLRFVEASPLIVYHCVLPIFSS
ncbi:hypothetical protein BDZ45DRAFT_801887 [Acephala macrosclerotiorum]|nr:hypothetical protein BDZ45DRAFT_801887 [Acephala macrosclerotiorum]